MAALHPFSPCCCWQSRAAGVVCVWMLFTRASCAGHTSAKWDFIDAVICLLSRHRATPRWGVGRSHFFTNPSRRVKSNDLAWAEWKGEFVCQRLAAYATCSAPARPLSICFLNFPLLKGTRARALLRTLPSKVENYVREQHSLRALLLLCITQILFRSWARDVCASPAAL